MSSSNKSGLRKQLRAARRALDAQSQTAAGQGLLQQLSQLEEFQSANNVALYLANDGEIDQVNVMRWIQTNSRHCYLPVVKQNANRNSLMFAEVTATTEFIDNKFGIAEPVVDEAELIEARSLDLVLLPLVGFDPCGNRIGMGGGFYDTTFEFLGLEERHKPVLIGIAHEMQKVDRIDAEHWDIPLSTVVTDQQIYRL